MDIGQPRPISVTIVPAMVFDNPTLLRVNPEYLAGLLSLPTLERERLRGEIGRSDPPPVATSNGNGVPSSTRSRPSSTSFRRNRRWLHPVTNFRP
jgi:hypothetical protein